MRTVTRSQWGARPPKLPPQKIGTVLGLALHYSGMDSDEQSNHANCAARVRGIQNYHMDTVDPPNHWNDIAYNWIVCKHGYIFVGRGWNSRSAANGTTDGNDHYLATCFLGDDSEGRDDVTIAGRLAIVQLFSREFERRPSCRQIQPHSFFFSTGCPGNELRTFILNLRKVLK